MANLMRSGRVTSTLSSALRRGPTCPSCRHLVRPTRSSRNILPATSPNSRHIAASFHSSARRLKNDRTDETTTPTDFSALDVLGNTPVPSTSVDICMTSGFQLNNGTRVTDGSGVLLVGGEAFRWRPWEASSPSTSRRWRLFNAKGQYDIAPESLNLFAHLWPRPDLLVLGLGPENRPISPELRKAVSAMGMRVEVLDTRNAAAQFNLLATERGVDDVAAALVPIGWVEGKGAGDGDEGVRTHE